MLGLAFVQKGDQDETDLELKYPDFKLYIEKGSIAAMRDSIIDFKCNDFGGRLSVKAPFIKALPQK